MRKFTSCLISWFLCSVFFNSHSLASRSKNFVVDYEWQYLNFTWPDPISYENALANKIYIPENNIMTGMKIYKDKIYLSLSKYRSGTPVTLSYIPMSSEKFNILLRPFPNWEMNTLGKHTCSTLQNVQSMEIDRHGIMWVLDGVRINNITTCPAKIVLLDLNNNGAVVHSYNFPNEISLPQGGFLDDIVLDESEGSFAYITDASSIDPGLIVYSRCKNRSWKFRDVSMFPDLDASGIEVDNVRDNNLIPINGIALSPKNSEVKYVFFCALVSYKLYAISTSILKNEEESEDGQWRRDVVYIGRKQSQSDGLVIDNEGTMYYTLPALYGIGKWNTKKPIVTSQIIYQNRKNLVWPDTFSFDNRGYLYVNSNNILRYFNLNITLKFDSEINFRISKIYTGTKSYMY